MTGQVCMDLALALDKKMVIVGNFNRGGGAGCVVLYKLVLSFF